MKLNEAQLETLRIASEKRPTEIPYRVGKILVSTSRPRSSWKRQIWQADARCSSQGLRSMEKRGLITMTTWGSMGLPGAYVRITEAGEKHLNDQTT